MREQVGRSAVLVAAGLLGAVVLAGCGSSSSPSAPAVSPLAVTGGHATIGNLTITHAYIPDPATPSISAAYFTVTNSGAADRLVSIASPAFGSAVLNRYVTDSDGAESMVAVPSGQVIPAHGRLVLMPGSYHVMLQKPRHPVKQGTTARLTLRFAKAGVVSLVVPVVADTGLPSASDATMAPNMPGMNMSSG